MGKLINENDREDKICTETLKKKKFDELDSTEVEELIAKFSKEVKFSNVDQIHKIRNLYYIIESVHGKNIILRKEAIVSLCLVFLEVLPSYKITELTEKQKSQKMKKETLILFKQEEGLLAIYQKYLKLIHSVLTSSFNIEKLNHIHWTKEDRSTILKCACKLYERNPTFNKSEDLLNLIIPFLNSEDTKEVKVASRTICKLLKNDLTGEASVNICKEIKNYCRDKQFNVKAQVILPLLEMEIEDTFYPEDNKMNKKDRKKMSNLQNKQNKKKAIEKNKNAKVIEKESLDVKIKNNSLVIRYIFYIYFSLLKASKINSKVLEVVLDSIGKFGRLVESKILPDVFKVLTSLTEKKNISINNRIKSIFVLLLVLTAGKTQEILDIDAGKYTSRLLNIIETEKLNENCVLTSLKCTNKLMIKRRGRIAGFECESIIKTLIKLAYNQMETKYLCSYILINIIKYLRLYPKLQFMFEDEDNEIIQDIGASKSFNYDKNMPESIKQLNELSKSSCYEIGGVAKKIKKYFTLQDSGENALQMKNTLEQLTKLTNEELFETLKTNLKSTTKRTVEEMDCE